MRYARPTRHYRVAEKQVQQNPYTYKGTFIPNSDKTKLGIFAAGVGALLFVLGLLIGAVANRD